MQTSENHGKIRIAGVVALAVLAIAGASYSAYAWQQNQKLSSDINDKSAQIQTLNDKVASLQAEVSTLNEDKSGAENNAPVVLTDQEAAQAAAQLYLDAQILDTKYVATVHQLEGDFASAGVSPADRPDYGLSSIFLKKVSDAWVVVFQGTQQPEKAIGDRFGLPKDWYQE